MKRTRISVLLVIALLLQLYAPLTAGAADFTPNPQTEYAKRFIAACDGQTWFINEIERLLNAQQRTLDTITGAEDLVEIKSIGLKGQNITGHIPAAIGELSELRYLFLSDNHLSGDIPSALYTLPKLQNVDLGGNDYAGAIPSEFGTMPALKTLVLKDNQYTGTIPDTILSNTQIEVLNLMGNQLTGGFPAAVAGMSSLKYLNLSENAIGGTIPDLSALNNLISLSAWQCGLTGTIPETLYSLSGLQILDLSENKLEGEISAGIANLADLQYLALDTNPLRGVLPDAFTQTALTEIHLENTYLRGFVPATLKARHDAGAKVYLNNNYMTGAVLKDMPNNSGNFTDGAASEQHQLAGTRSTVTVSKDGTVNLYALLLNKSLTTGSTAKVLLRPDEYVVTFDDTKVQVTADSSGIYVKALTDIPLNTNFSITIQIKDNTGSEYSKVKLTLTTDVTSGGGGGIGGGGGGTSTPGYTVSADKTENGAIAVSPKSASKGDTVTITATPDKGYTLESLTVLDKDGKALTLTDKGGGKYTFVMPAGKITVKAVFMDDNTMLNFFTDVHAEDYYYDAVLWAAQKGITGGMSDTLFAPNAACTRAQIVTFLWRAAGSPEPKQLSTFGDVPADAYYAKAVAWAVENGITDGTSDTTFAPGIICTRAHGVTFLSRAAKANTASGNSNFADVDANAYYASAVKWAVDNGITNGISSSLFGPDSSCTRAQIVTFLYRMYGSK